MLDEVMQYGIRLPFLGDVKLWPFLLLALAVFLAWDYRKVILSYAAKKAVELFKSLVSGVKETVQEVTSDVKDAVNKASVSEPAIAASQAVDSPLAALQSLTVWAVKEADKTVVPKVTALFLDVQKHYKESK